MAVSEHAHVDAHAKGKGVELQGDASAVASFEIEIMSGFHFDTKVEAVVADQGSAAGLHAGEKVAFAVSGFPVRSAGRRGGTAEDSADHGLCAPRSYIVSGSSQADRAGVNFRAAFGLKIVTKSHERTVKVLGVADGVANSQVNEWRENAETVFQMVYPVPSGVTSAETLLRFASGRSKVNGRIIIEEFARKIPLEVRTNASKALARNSLRVFLLDRTWRADKIVRDAQVHAEMARKVVAYASAQIEDAAVAASAAFELHSRVESRGKALGRLCDRPTGRSDRSLCRNGQCMRK